MSRRRLLPTGTKTRLAEPELELELEEVAQRSGLSGARLDTRSAAHGRPAGCQIESIRRLSKSFDRIEPLGHLAAGSRQPEHTVGSPERDPRADSRCVAT